MLLPQFLSEWCILSVLGFLRNRYKAMWDKELGRGDTLFYLILELRSSSSVGIGEMEDDSLSYGHTKP